MLCGKVAYLYGIQIMARHMYQNDTMARHFVVCAVGFYYKDVSCYVTGAASLHPGEGRWLGQCPSMLKTYLPYILMPHEPERK